MKRLIVAVSAIGLALVVTAIAAILWARSELVGSLPELSANITLKGLHATVDVYYDEYAIPHIYAQNREDLMFAVGFLSARHRLWQMDLTRRIAAGRLAELFGEDVIKLDLLARVIGFQHVAEEQFGKLSPEGRATLEAFSNGVNASIESTSDLPPEFRFLKYRPEPWKPSDSLAISGLLSWELSKNFRTEIVMMRLVSRVGAERAAEIGPTYPSDGPFIIPHGAFPLPAEEIDESMTNSLLQEGAELLDELAGTSGGSNSWVIGPGLTSSGAPILANDPHLSGTRMPSIWYYAHLVGGGFDVIGGIVPGTPMPLLGHNRRIGWGITNMTADVQDLYIERINTKNQSQYEYDGEWVDLDLRTERIYFKTDQEEQSFIDRLIRTTVHGPVVNELAPGIGQAISLSWTGSDPTPQLESLSGICRARNWDDFCRALSKFRVAPQNFIYADVDGHIGYYGAGRVPIRPAGNGTMPQKGWTSETLWKGYVPFEEMPHAFNPPDGYIVTANNQVISPEYEHFLSAYWAPKFRYKRIAELVEQSENHDANNIAKMQMDVKSLFAELLVRRVLPTLKELDDPFLLEAVRYLEAWDFSNTTTSVASTIYHEFLITFAWDTFADNLGSELSREYLKDYYLWIERFVQLLDEESAWFDNARTEQPETSSDIARKSFTKAVESLRERLGEDMSAWEWGRVHEVEFRHALDRNRLAKWIFNYGPFPFPGDGESINRGTFAFDRPYEVTMAASLRHVMDFSHLQRTSAIHTTGQSGHPASSHYHDFADRWLKGEYVTMMMNMEDFGIGIEGHLRLEPLGASYHRAESPREEKGP